MDNKLAELWQIVAGLRARRRGANAGELQGRPVSTDAPADNAVLAWDATNKKWRPLPALTRKMPMSTLVTPQAVTAGQMTWPDAVTSDLQAVVPVPTDWVAGTDITLVVMVYKAGAGAESANMLSYISAHSTGETHAWNIEDAVAVAPTIQGAKEIRTLERTVAGASISAGEEIEWFFRRQGGDGADTLDEALFLLGPWIEYTAAF